MEERSAAERILFRIVEGDNSDLDLSDDEREDEQVEPEAECEEEDGDEIEPSDRETDSDEGRRPLWVRNRTFTPVLPKIPDFHDDPTTREDWSPMEYFSQYIDDNIFEEMATCTNQREVQTTGRSLHTTAQELKIFFGISIHMACLGFPRLAMFWASKTRVPLIRDKMSRDRYFKLRTSLKMVDDLALTDEEKKADVLWKVRPLLNHVKEGCLSLPGYPNVCIDEQMIPFTGKCPVRQFVRGKPNPTGLKVFVLVSPNGLMLDFEVFQGKNTFVAQRLGIGAASVLRMVETVPSGTHVFFDRWFTTMDVMVALQAKGLPATGMIMKNRVPSVCKLPSDKELKKDGKRGISLLVRNHPELVVTKWNDNQPVLKALTAQGIEPEDICHRWCAKKKEFIQVKRPACIKEYNKNMGGVDLLDRMLSFYRMSTRTKKWTSRVITHFFDIAIANAWIQYHLDSKVLERPEKQTKQYLDFKLDLAEELMGCDDQYSDKESSDKESSDNDDSDEYVAPPPHKRRMWIPQPEKSHAKKGGQPHARDG